VEESFDYYPSAPVNLCSLRRYYSKKFTTLVKRREGRFGGVCAAGCERVERKITPDVDNYILTRSSI